MGSPRKKTDPYTTTAVATQVLDRMPEQPMAVVPPSETAQVMSMIERIAMSPDADMDKLERLMAMKEKLDAQRAAREFAVAMKDAQAEMPVIVKNKTNTQTKSRYAELEVINDAIVPVYTKHGLSLSFDTIPASKPEWVAVRCRIRHIGGHVEESTYETPFDTVGSGGNVNKTVTHGLASGVTYARRYITIMVFNLVIKGEDQDGNQPRSSEKLVSDDDAAAIKEWMELLQFEPSDMGEFLALYKVAAIAELPANRVREVIAALKLRAKNEGLVE
jgi:hypothetical protein